MSQRYFSDTPIDSNLATLTGSEAQHLSKVMRATPGTEVTLFDGSGAEFLARVSTVNRATVELIVLSRIEIDRELPFDLTLGVALPKGDRQRFLVEKSVELGVTRMVPLRTERGVAQPVDQAQRRLQRAVIEASKQCQRNRLMEIADPVSFSDYVINSPNSAVRLIAHPNLRSERIEFNENGPVALAVGPEGGFTDKEVNTAKSAGWTTVSLGPRILRIETAAIALAALAANR